MTNRVTVDIVTERPDGAFVLVLVEEGPWEDPEVSEHLRRLQDRLYNTVDAFLQGAVADLYPDSRGRAGIVRLDCFDVPKEPVQNLFQRLSEFVLGSPEYDPAQCGGNVSSIDFEFNWESLESPTIGDQSAVR